jgi:hypothetical protein
LVIAVEPAVEIPEVRLRPSMLQALDRHFAILRVGSYGRFPFGGVVLDDL